MLDYGISFRIESDKVGTEKATVKLYKCVSSETSVQIRQEIALLGDDLDASGQFLLHGPDWHKSVCVHMMGNLLSPPEDAESLVAWYATIGLGSFFLGSSWKGQEIRQAVQLEQSLEITAEDVQSSITKGMERWKANRGDVAFDVLSGSAIPCFLLQEVHENPSKIGSVRERIKEETTKYLKHLGLRSDVVETAQNEIDQIDELALKEHESWVAGNPNVFWHAWCNYFRTLDDSDLSLFNPNKPV